MAAAHKYGFGGRMLGMLRALRNSAAHGMSRADEPARLPESMRAEEVQASAGGTEEKLRLRNVT